MNETFVTCGTMKLLEKRADQSGLSYYQMMENAGTAAAEKIMDLSEKGIVVIACGKGNNGGDGFVVARILAKAGYQVIVILVEGEPKTEDAITNYHLAKEMGIHIYDMSQKAVLTDFHTRPDVIVDAVYGTGFRGRLDGNGIKIAMYMQKYREKGSLVFALDIPSGLAGDFVGDEEKDPNAVKANYTIAFHARKPVHLQDGTQENCGEIIVVGIGIDEKRLLDYREVTRMREDRVPVTEEVKRPKEIREFSAETQAEITRFLEETSSKSYDFQDFVNIIAKLRAPDGCPWDRKQTHESLKPNFVEEVNEALDAIDNKDMDNLCEELGDVLLQVVLHAQIAAEEGQFTMDDVIQDVSEKMIRRHPHVFGNIKVADVDEQLDLWEEIKRREKAMKK